jgi:hypothetical protein
VGHRSTPFVLPMKKSPPRKPKPAKTPSRLTTKRRGEVAEAAFLHKVASLGFTVAKPWSESDRFDFLVQSGSQTADVPLREISRSLVFDGLSEGRRVQGRNQRGTTVRTTTRVSEIPTLTSQRALR